MGAADRSPARVTRSTEARPRRIANWHSTGHDLQQVCSTGGATCVSHQYASISMQDGSLFAADGAQAEEGTQQDLALPLLVSPDDTLRPIAKRQCPACRGAHRAHTCQRRTASQEVSRVVEPYVGHHLCFAPSHGAYSLRPPARVQLSSKQLSSKLHLS